MSLDVMAVKYCTEKVNPFDENRKEAASKHKVPVHLTLCKLAALRFIAPSRRARRHFKINLDIAPSDTSMHLHPG